MRRRLPHAAPKPPKTHRTVWVCPECRTKNGVRRSTCRKCAWRMDGLGRKPGIKDCLVLPPRRQ